MDLKYLSYSEGKYDITIYLNALEDGLIDSNALDELKNLLLYIDDETEYKFIIIRGSNKLFCKGLNIDNFNNGPIVLDGFRKWEGIVNIIVKMKKISIAVLEGNCFNAGLELALACDFRIATHSAHLAYNILHSGILPGQIIYQLSKFCGYGKAFELIQTGRLYTPEAAQVIGIIHKVCKASEVENEINELFEEFKDINLEIYYLSRRLLKESFNTEYEDFIGCYFAAQHRVLSKLNPRISSLGDNNESTKN